ncbi:MAG: hypothetical protein AAFN77_06820 [Planctomycetota bacterium]
MSALDSLVNSSVDYAGLFPPAMLPLDQVVKNYADYLNNNRRQMLGRLIIPATRLDEFLMTADRLDVWSTDEPKWRISALVPAIANEDGQLDDESLRIEMRRLSVINDNPHVVVDAIEVRSESPETTRMIANSVPSSIDAFIEFDWREDPADNIQAIAALERDHLFAKIRTGGVTADLIPSPAMVARFLLQCAKHNVGVKATAGLHHPLRGNYRLTYEADADEATMHGFVNVFVAACLAYSKQITDESTLASVLASEDASDFMLGEQQIGFGNYGVEDEVVGQLRSHKIISFGSCSFEEPSVEIESALQID